jgi:hypothetical protein
MSTAEQATPAAQTPPAVEAKEKKKASVVEKENNDAEAAQPKPAVKEPDRVAVGRAAPQATAHIYKALPHHMTLASVSRADFRVIVEDMNITIDDILKPIFWCNVGDKLVAATTNHPFAIIEAVWADASRYARLIVVDAGPQWASVKLLDYKELDRAGEIVVAEPYRVERVNAVTKWCIIRQSDGEIMRKGIGSREEAEREKNEMARMIAA